MKSQFTSFVSKLKSEALHSKTLYSLHWLYFSLLHRRLTQASRAWWEANRGVHAGRRGFVIGNGPSLRIEDLGALTGEVTIASNKIYLAYPQTAWRPTYLSCADKLVWEKIQADLPNVTDQIFALSTLDLRIATVPTIVFRHRGGFEADDLGFSFDSAQGQYGGRTVTYHNLQMAVHLGLNPIYLLGCDHYYTGETGVNPTGAVVQHQGADNHFIKGYRVAGEKVNSAPVWEMTRAFERVARVCAARGIKVFNATRGGHLEAFPRVSFDSLIAR